MAFRPQPRVLTDEDIKKYEEASAKQTGKTKTPATVDADKYPVFDIPVCDKRLVYIPDLFNLEFDEELGMEVKELKVDRGAFHTVRHRGSFSKYRCSGDIAEIEGFDGSCPLCETQSEVWDLYNVQYKDIASKKGIDIDSEAAKDGLKEDRRKLVSEMAVSRKQIFLTFPLYNCELQPGTINPVLDTATHMFKGRLEWYTISEDTYNDKWKATLQAMPVGEQTPCGNWFILDYTYKAENGKPTKMQSASNLKVINRSMLTKNDEQNKKVHEIEKAIDALAEDWTPALARRVIYANMPYDVQALGMIAEEAMASTRDKLMLYDSAKSKPVGAISTTAGSPEDIAKNFGATEDMDIPE